MLPDTGVFINGNGKNVKVNAVCVVICKNRTWRGRCYIRGDSINKVPSRVPRKWGGSRVLYSHI